MESRGLVDLQVLTLKHNCRRENRRGDAVPVPSGIPSRQVGRGFRSHGKKASRNLSQGKFLAILIYDI